MLGAAIRRVEFEYAVNAFVKGGYVAVQFRLAEEIQEQDPVVGLGCFQPVNLRENRLVIFLH